MPLKFLPPRPIHPVSSPSRFRSLVNPLARVKDQYHTAQQASSSATQSQIKQLSQDRARINRATPTATDPTKTSLERRGDLVSNRIGWLQSLLPKK